MTSYPIVCFRLLLLLAGNLGICVSAFGGTKIELWYGDRQTFGQLGNPQRQINIVGRVSGYEIEPCASFFLNDNPEQRQLTLGSDLHRLAKDGDFNIEIERGELEVGRNAVRILVEEVDGNRIEKTVVVDYHEGNTWPLPYEINWNSVESLQDVVEIVDGEWMLTSEGLRTSSPYYDRVLAIGDISWKDYEVSTSVKFHDFSEPKPGPPTYRVAHVAIAVRWPGHDEDDYQPNRKWYPLGATAEFRLEKDYQNCRWRIFDGEVFYAEQGRKVYEPILPEVWYGIKHRVESLSDTRTLYSVKFWPADKPEPEEWDFQAIEISETLEYGSACILAHNTDVTFGNVMVVPVTE